MAKIEKMMAKGVAYFKRNGIKKTCVRVVRKMVLSAPVDYEKWLEAHTPDQGVLNLQRQDNTGEKPIVMVKVIDRTNEVSQQILQSVANQTYGFLAVGDNIEYADYCLLLRNEVFLCPNAVYELMAEAMRYPQADLLYADDDVWRNGKFQDPFFKPEFDSCMFQQWNYLGDVLLIRKDLAQKAGNLADFDGIVEMAGEIRRVPQILSHTDGSYRKKRKLVQRALNEEPKVSVIIPNKDHGWELRSCVESLMEQGGYQNLEILIVENNSQKKETFALYKIIQETYLCVRVITWEDAFNYAAINNYAAGLCDGEYLLFLNNDTKVKKEGVISELVKWGSMEGCGAIGARLLYADETIQHAGVVLGYGGIAGHAFEGMKQIEYEAQDYAHLVRRMTAVTAACMLVRREAFEAVGGFSEELKVAYNDIDLCMKLQDQGYMVLYDPSAQMYHFESQTRGFEMTTEKAARVQEEAALFCERWKEELEHGDRFYNPNLTLEKPDFSLKRE